VSKEFIEERYGSSSIQKAIVQQKQLDYFLISELQDDRIDNNYLQSWAERQYQTNDYFLNWIKIIFKSENFLLLYKYLRYPLPSAKLVKNKIEPQLRRVFKAEDSDFKYDVTGKSKDDYIGDLNITEFNNQIFENLLYNHNSVLVTDLSDTNKPIRYFVDINKIVSIQEQNNKIHRIAYKACIIHEDKEVNGVAYIDNEKYAFYDKDYNLINEEPHDLGYTPVDFITPDKYKNDFIVRQSLFTYIRTDLEEYVFLKTLQRMTEPNGAIPIVTKIEVQDSNNNEEPGTNGEPNADTIMGSQSSKVFSQNSAIGSGDLNPGTIHEVPLEALQDSDGNINTDAVVNYLNFHYTPIEALNYLNERIQQIEESIIVTMVGDLITGSEEAKNIPQVEKSLTVLENTLINIAYKLNTIRKSSDTNMLSLKYGKELVNEVFIHYGTDFFLDSESKLFDDLQKAPNSLERKDIIVRINRNRYKNNIDILSRKEILYDLMPYVSDIDFDKALSQQTVSEIDKLYQLRFTYWISIFEAQYGDIVTFYNNLDVSKAEKLTLINNLIIDIIKQNNLTLIDPKEDSDDLSEKDREDEKIKIEAQSRLKGTVGGG